MRPTFSIICFTVLSGIGYGAWFLIGLGVAIGPLCGPHCAPGAIGIPLVLCQAPFVSLSGLLVALVFVAAGLLCSLGHLGQPQRAWRALSQWRSSWLSREGVAAIATFVPAAILVVCWLSSWFEATNNDSPTFRLLGIALSAGAALTVLCTANIYASLKPIAAWQLRHVVPAYLLLGLYGGALLLATVATLPNQWQLAHNQRMLLVAIGVFAAVGAWLKIVYWRAIDSLATPSAGHAIGLDAVGNVGSFEAPHTEENYLTHEMGFVLARKHARKLRRIALVFAFFVPALLVCLALAVPAFGMPAAWLALASGLAGLLVERWLFFAEAKHAVMAYYAR
jgi:sulfite dehydrogenase (quinone) subunit SoeC